MKAFDHLKTRAGKIHKLQRSLPKVWMVIILLTLGSLSGNIAIAQNVLLSLDLKQGWNFFSLPVTPQLDDLESFFKNKKVGRIWVFRNGKYEETGVLNAGVGYWMYMSEPETILYTGEPTAPLLPPEYVIGWNNFASFESLAIPGNAMGTVWTFDNSHFHAVSGQLLPGLAYWVNFENLNEIANGSAQADQNGNGILDFWEAIWGLNSVDGDGDKDLLSNLQEFQNATSPMNPDTDDDNIIDGQEFTAGSNPSDATSVPPPSSLAFVDQPPAAATAGTLAKIRLALIDQFGNIVRRSGDEVSILLQDNPSSGVLSGTTTMNTVDGIVEFTDLGLDELGAGYTLAASTNGLGPVVSDLFEILQSVEAFIAGRVIDENNVPIPGAKVTIPSLNTEEKFTNGDGVFNLQLSSIPASNSVCVQVISLGFTTGEETVAVFPNETTSTTIRVKHVQVTKEGTVAELIDDDGNIVIETPGRSACVIVQDPGSTLGTTGNVCLELTYGDPKVDQEVFPGEFAAEDMRVAEEIVRLASIMFSEIKVTNMDTGEPIEDLNGTAIMILEIPPGTVNPKTQAPFEKDDTIEIWDFDEAKGIWVRGVDDNGNEIDAIVEIDSTTGKLVARFTVPHFSWWNVDVPIDTHHCLTGKVVDQEGNPVANAKVTATGVDYNGSSDAFTEQNGNYCLDVMRGSTVILGARLDVTLSQQVTINVPDVQSTCSGPQGANNVCTPVEELVLGDGTCISGTVIDGGGNPVPNTIVEAISLDLWAITDANGNYCLDGLPLNSTISLRSVAVINNRFVSVNASVQTTPDPAKCIDNTCVQQNLVLDLDGACISGVIRDNENRALENAVIWSTNGGWTTTDTNGLYCITVPKNSNETLNITYWNPQTGILHQETITIADTGDSSDCSADNCFEQNVTLNLLAVGCINGTVKSDTGIPLEGVLVYVPGYPWGVTDSSGNYCITAPVRNNVTVFCRLTAPNGLFISSQDTVDVTDSGTCPNAGCSLLDHTLTIDIGCVKGVVQAEGQAVADVRVVNSIGSVTTTNSTGAFCLEMVKGEDENLNFFKSLNGSPSISFSRLVNEADTASTETCQSGNCFDLGVLVGNRSPVLLELSSSQNTALSGETVTVTVSATDPDEDPLTYSWSGLGTIEGTGESIQWTLPNVTTEGNIPIGVQISDSKGGITSGNLTVTVTPNTDGNRPPTIRAIVGNPSTLAPNQTAAISVDAADPDGNNLTFSWTASGGSVNGNSATVNWLAPAEEGNYKIDVTVSDGSLTTSGSTLFTVTTATSGTLTITVTEPDDLMPVAGARVLLHDSNGNISQEITTGENGIAGFGDIGRPRASFTVLRKKNESNENNFDPDWFGLSAIDVMTGNLIIPIENGEEEDPNDSTIEFDIVVENVPEEATSVFFGGVLSFGSAPEKNGSTWTFRNQRLQLDSEFITPDGTINITAAAFKVDQTAFTTEVLKGGSVPNIVLSSLNGSTVPITLDRDPLDIPFTANKPAQNISLTVSGSSTPSLVGFTFGQNPQTSGMLSFINLDLQSKDFYIQNAISAKDASGSEFTDIRKLGNTAPTDLTITFPDYSITTITPTFDAGVLTQIAWAIEGPTESTDLADVEFEGITNVNDQRIEWGFFLSPTATSFIVPKLATDIGQVREPSTPDSSSLNITIWEYSNVNGFDNFLNQIQAVFKTGRPGVLSLFEEIFELGDVIRYAEKELESDENNNVPPFPIPN